ncbi:hypothetical protein [Flavilitoribacter nigricans]|uniref:Uncharacterized protein n=1 Tax=Flavilitoribacter nigricans (strain ATCC 23147 / DSM 23189 / NBRC 102662 / NCIMB 1420 / SS-2) TaxID=1122177 RepID=A0A2D0MX68_FLAN2|nr:hypothetical protein [Flavilitoribacter nigricans]PHN00807.1 hypothetical protein CRP01_40410 [Flavilitoribacter nigricans DSM 23189 = NBRC 102662]
MIHPQSNHPIIPSSNHQFYLIILLSLISCTKPQISTTLPAPRPQPHALTITGYYHPKTCRVFFDARKTQTGTLLHDDTTEPKNCRDESLPFQIHTFLFPTEKENYHGLRIEGRYPFTTENFQLANSVYPDFQQQATHLYTFTTSGKYILQIFFPERQWNTFIDDTERITFTFQVTKTHPIPLTPKFTLLQGQYDPTIDLVNFQNLPDLHADKFSSSMNADSVSSSVQFHLIDSIHTFRVRSIYHLLTEDFTLWSDSEDCRPLQNWDLSLIPATGYNLLEIKLDPPFLECLKRGEIFHFRMALLR